MWHWEGETKPEGGKFNDEGGGSSIKAPKNRNLIGKNANYEYKKVYRSWENSPE
jgi:hypothetical protein